MKTCTNGDKIAFVSEKAARRHRGKNMYGRVRIYQCPYCRFYHFTHRA